MKNKIKTLIDKGFDSDYSIERINEFNNLFTSEVDIQNFVYKIHEEDNTLDMKRGEFYPEILRCMVSMKRAVASAYNLDEGQCQPNFGSNGSIDTILTAIKIREINKGVNQEVEGGMLVATPTYFRNYNSATAKQIRIHKVPLKNWNLDIEEFLKALKEKKPTTVFLVTPNNPTGIPIKDEHLIKIIEATPVETLVVIDRTLVNINPEISTKELLVRFKNKQVAVLHSLSKYWGLSHLRVGFALYSNLKLANEIQPHLPLGISVEGAIKATKHISEDGELKPSRTTIDNLIKSKKILSDFCSSKTGFSYTDFGGNYCLLILPSTLTSHQIERDLQKEGIYTMAGLDFPEPLEGVIRLHTGGRPEFMQQTINALKNFIKNNETI